MAVSRSPGEIRENSFVSRFVGSRYDLLLVVIPLSLALAAAVGLVLSVPVHFTIGVASVFCAACLADAVYFNPPTTAS